MIFSTPFLAQWHHPKATPALSSASSSHSSSHTTEPFWWVSRWRTHLKGSAQRHFPSTEPPAPTAPLVQEVPPRYERGLMEASAGHLPQSQHLQLSISTASRHRTHRSFPPGHLLSLARDTTFGLSRPQRQHAQLNATALHAHVLRPGTRQAGTSVSPAAASS